MLSNLTKPKGYLISKGFFAIFTSTKKTNEKILYFCPGNYSIFVGSSPTQGHIFSHLFFKMPDDIRYKKICKNN